MTILPRGVGFATNKVTYDQPISLRFGYLVIAFRPARPGTRFSIEETHVPFLVPNDTQADLVLDCEVAPLRPLSGPVTYSAGRSWDLRRDEHGAETIVFRGGAEFGTDVWQLTLDSEFRHGKLVEAPVMPDRAVRADGYPLLEYIVARLLARHEGALIHASTAIVNEGAYVFVGHSGAGKSTIASIAESEGARIPTDDRTVLTIRNQQPMAWGTPWHGSLIRKSPEGAILRRMYLLQQAKDDRCEPLPPGRAVKELFVRLIQPRLHPTEVQLTLEVLERIVQRIPVAVLHFRPTPAAFALAIRGSTSARQS